MTTALVWFRRDLRLHDNGTLVDAADADTLIPVFVFDPDPLTEGMFGQKKTSPYRATFLWNSVEQLRERLDDRGSPLVVRRGDTAEEIAALVDEADVDRVHYQRLPGTEEAQRAIQITEQVDADVKRHQTHTLYHSEDLPTPVNRINNTFSPWRKSVQYDAPIRDTVSTPDSLPGHDVETGEIPTPSEFGLDSAEPDERAAIAPHGGETYALDRLDQYVWEEDRLREYKQTRNGLLGQGFSSKLSAWLAHGCLSPRYVYEEIQRYEDERVSNDSTYWLYFELMWRDFFQFQLSKHGADFFQSRGIRNLPVEWRDDAELFDRWCNGTTGIPFVDANMRELNATGYMSNRGRQNVASFLTDVLGIDWRRGAAYFEATLIDYDVAANWGNWAYVAGVGNDSRDDRYFNVVKQGENYDENGEYIRHWVPELAQVPATGTHRPWLLSEGHRAMYGLDDYPEPIVPVEEHSYAELVESQRPEEL